MILCSQPPSGGCVLKLLPIDRGLPLLSQPPSGGCVLKLLDGFALKGFFHPAAFGRLCVETLRTSLHFLFADQPPSGGCVLKPSLNLKQYHYDHQPPSGGCVLKLCCPVHQPSCCGQPPSGGCVLKPIWLPVCHRGRHPAAFGRLCVETTIPNLTRGRGRPAAFGRLCVETAVSAHNGTMISPSRLRAAVC